MIELLPLTVSEYFDLEDKRAYDWAMKYARPYRQPVDEYKVGDVTELSFGFVKDLQYEIEQGLTWEKTIDFVLLVTKMKTIGTEPLDKICRFSNFLIKGVEDIILTEESALAYEPSENEFSAGMDKFKDLGVYLQIRSLTGGDVTRFDAVRALPYSLCFTELYTAKLLKEYERDLRKVIPKK